MLERPKEWAMEQVLKGIDFEGQKEGDVDMLSDRIIHDGSLEVVALWADEIVKQVEDNMPFTFTAVKLERRGTMVGDVFKDAFRCTFSFYWRRKAYDSTRFSTELTGDKCDDELEFKNRFKHKIENSLNKEIHRILWGKKEQK